MISAFAAKDCTFARLPLEKLSNTRTLFPRSTDAVLREIQPINRLFVIK